MGCTSSKQEVDESQQTKTIDTQIEKDKETMSREVKLLLLGAGDSGKSTILRQMKLIHNQGYTKAEIQLYKDVIFSNVVQSMKAILDALPILGIELESPEKMKPYIDALIEFDRKGESSNFGNGTLERSNTVSNYPDNINSSSNNSNSLPHNIVVAIQELWKDEGIKQAYGRSNEYQLIDSAGYFFQEIERLGELDYKPSDQDVLRCRVKTTGITELKFRVGILIYRMFDVGGQRSERRKWIHCFENVTAIVFVVALSEYDQVLFEDETTNRMEEALTLFDSICNSKWFINTSIILFFNKIDLFKEKIVISPMDRVFRDYTGGMDYELATQYIHDRFVNLNQGSYKQIYVQFTCATDTNQMKFVMSSVSDIILQSGLKNTGYM